MSGIISVEFGVELGFKFSPSGGDDLVTIGLDPGRSFMGGDGKAGLKGEPRFKRRRQCLADFPILGAGFGLPCPIASIKKAVGLVHTIVRDYIEVSFHVS
jgi:hypothetical protein